MKHYQTQKEQNRFWLKETEFAPDFEKKTESIFAQCNGYMGVRAAHGLSLIEEKRGMFLSGVFHKASEEEVTELVNCPDVTWIGLEIDGEKIYPQESKMESCIRKIDLNSGELVITYIFSLKTGAKTEITLRRFASVKDKNMFFQSVDIKVLEGKINIVKVKTGINGQMTNSGASHFKSVTARVYDKQMMETRCELEDDTVRIFSGCQLRKGNLEKKDFILERRSIYGIYFIRPDEDGRIYMEKHTHVFHGEETVRTDDRKDQLLYVQKYGYDHLFEEHCGIMSEYWRRTAVQIEGISLREEAAIRFAQYHIMGMTPWHTNKSSIAAKGLTGEGYKGHVFWDTEIFLAPSLLFTYPEEARRLLEYRFNGLYGARKKAMDYGFRGAMFPWEAAKSGEEETPLYAALNIHSGKANKVWSGIKEFHVTADIIYALNQYFEVTGDLEFMTRCGYEIAFEAAEFWNSCAVWKEDRERYEICDVIGPDEYTEHIDNNAYTNYMAFYCVTVAMKYAQALKEHHPEQFHSFEQKLDLSERLDRWKHFKEYLYLPKPDADGIIPQDDTFRSKPCIKNIEKYKESPIKQSVLLDYSREEVVNMQVLKQADVVMLLNLFPHLFPEDIVKKNVLFYEGRTIHDSSLSYCAHAQACAAIGAGDLAWDFFQRCLMIDIDDNPHDTTDGIHSASLGGIWNCLIPGFAGVNYEGGKLYVTPHLPKHWNRMQFQLVIRGVVLVFDITHEYIHITCSNMGEQSIPVQADGKEFVFDGELKVKYEKGKQI